MQLISQFIKTRMSELIESNVRLRVVGRRDRFSADLRALIQDAEVSSAKNSGLNLTVALDYGGCQDIVGAASRIAQEIENGLLTATDVTDDLFKARLSTRTLPPVDLLIRSGGETRISNFLCGRWHMPNFISPTGFGLILLPRLLAAIVEYRA